jgi:hypothetical protein
MGSGLGLLTGQQSQGVADLGVDDAGLLRRGRAITGLTKILYSVG